MTAQSLDDAQMRARAIARWEGEGGALSPSPENDALDESAMRLLARLGAALLESWSEVPPNLQPNLVCRARTMGAPGDAARIQGLLVRFLREHREDS
jgi:hypothetical protein